MFLDLFLVSMQTTSNTTIIIESSSATITPPTAPPTIAPVDAPVFPALTSIVVVIVSSVCWGEFVDVVGVVSDVVGSAVGGLSVVAYVCVCVCVCVCV